MTLLSSLTVEEDTVESGRALASEIALAYRSVTREVMEVMTVLVFEAALQVIFVWPAAVAVFKHGPPVMRSAIGNALVFKPRPQLPARNSEHAAASILQLVNSALVYKM